MSENAAPAVSVVLPVYNGERYLAEALDSVLAQTFTDFELLVIDDGSTDATPKILEEYAKRDERIRVLRNEINRGTAYSMNRGMAEARAELIARMDADDVCPPERLALQTAFMTAYPEITVLGGGFEAYETGVFQPFPLSDAAVRAHMLFCSPVANSGALMRRTPCLAVGQKSGLEPAEDYEFWTRLAKEPGVRFTNLDAVVLRYRLHPDLDRTSYRARQWTAVWSACRPQLSDLGIVPGLFDERAHKALWGYSGCPRWRIVLWVNLLNRHNNALGIYDREIFAAVCHERLGMCLAAAPWFPPWLKKRLPISLKRTLKLLLGRLIAKCATDRTAEVSPKHRSFLE